MLFTESTYNFCYYFYLLNIAFFQTEEKYNELFAFYYIILFFFLDIWFDLLVLGNVPVIMITLCLD